MVQFSQGFVHMCVHILIFCNHGITGGVYLMHTLLFQAGVQEGKQPNRFHIFYSSVSLLYRREVSRRRQLVVLIRSEACDYSDSLLAALPHLIQVPAAAVDAYVCAFSRIKSFSLTTLDLFTVLVL